jgi:beta-N-acetylhexosaminidase
MASAGITSTLKHFPGLGRVEQNSDYSMGVYDNQTTAVDETLQSFRVQAVSPEPFVMVSSAVYEKIDPKNPAVFSLEIIHRLLRSARGFAGLVLSDDLGNAQQVQNVSPGNRAIKFLNAGGDLIITVDPTTGPLMIDEMVKQAAADSILSARVETAVRRVLNAKFDRNLLSC